MKKAFCNIQDKFLAKLETFFLFTMCGKIQESSRGVVHPSPWEYGGLITSALLPLNCPAVLFLVFSSRYYIQISILISLPILGAVSAMILPFRKKYMTPLT